MPKGQYLMLLTSAAALVLSLWRYVEQRHKATEEACVHVVAMHAGRLRDARHALAGAVVFSRGNDGRIAYLLVQATAKPGEWVLPKGHVEPGEHPREAAVREVLEETGVWARVVCLLCRTDFGGAQVDFYLLESVLPRHASALETPLNSTIVDEARHVSHQPRLWPEDRPHVWCLGDQASTLATFDETKSLLERARETVSRIEPVTRSPS